MWNLGDLKECLQITCLITKKSNSSVLKDPKTISETFPQTSYTGFTWKLRIALEVKKRVLKKENTIHQTFYLLIQVWLKTSLLSLCECSGVAAAETRADQSTAFYPKQARFELSMIWSKSRCKLVPSFFHRLSSGRKRIAILLISQIRN